MYLWPDLGRFVWIWAIILGFGPFCLHLGHIAWIWAIWHNLGQNRPQRRRSPEDEAGGDGWTHRRSYRQIRLAFYKTLSPLGPPPKKERIVAKALDGQRYPLPLCGCEVVSGAAAPKGPMTYADFI